MLRRIAEKWPGKISRKELKRKMDCGDKFILVDARSPDSYRSEHIKGAISLPLSEVDERAEQMLDKKNKIIVYCNSFSCTASGEEVRRLKMVGFKNIKHYAGGIIDWKKAGYPTERGKSY